MDNAFSDLLDVEKHYFSALEKVFSATEGESEKRICKRNELFLDLTRDDKCIWLVKSGLVGFYRKSDRLLIHETQAPVILGLVQSFYSADVIVLAHTEIILHVLPRETALKIIETEGLWREVALILGRILKSYVNRDLNMVAQDAYHIVKHHLRLLMAMSVEERYAITATKFITSRTKLSRSRVMDILRQLNAGNYITIKSGILVALNTLPDKF
ncbi:helix-turn-helix domain-containing protein [Rahnella sp. PCH160]|uniref:helix-turn-helix domain-containing protein n=1 Tax=Rahnella sp. PCH160 TaxID=3447928 RepID=UPI0039FC4BF9